MPISEGDVAAELVKIRAITTSAHKIEDFIEAVLKAITDGDPIWAEIDPTAGQKSTLLAKYDTLKSDLKTLVTNY